MVKPRYPLHALAGYGLRVRTTFPGARWLTKLSYSTKLPKMGRTHGLRLGIFPYFPHVTLFVPPPHRSVPRYL